MNLYAVTMNAYGMRRTRYIEAESVARARELAEQETSIGSVTRVRLVPEFTHRQFEYDNTARALLARIETP